MTGVAGTMGVAAADARGATGAALSFAAGVAGAKLDVGASDRSVGVGGTAGTAIDIGADVVVTASAASSKKATAPTAMAARERRAPFRIPER